MLILVQVVSCFCLVMFDMELMKFSNIGWFIVDILLDIEVFQWLCIELLQVLFDLVVYFDYQFMVVFLVFYVGLDCQVLSVLLFGKLLLFIMFDGIWIEVCKMFCKSFYFDVLLIIFVDLLCIFVYYLCEVYVDG